LGKRNKKFVEGGEILAVRSAIAIQRFRSSRDRSIQLCCRQSIVVIETFAYAIDLQAAERVILGIVDLEGSHWGAARAA
jgi:hypothetical protein